jgi:ribosomal protein S18 acetylase RimI-like enzyme
LALSVVRGSVEDLDALEPLWVGVHRVHAASMPELAPYVSDAETWDEHRPLYVELFEKPDTRLFLARLDEALVGYALIHVEPVRETWVADTWRTGERIGELESIAVAPEHRGRGIGSALLDAVDREFEALGVADVIIGLLPGNEGARRLYESRGFRPTWMYLSRFAGR